MKIGFGLIIVALTAALGLLPACSSDDGGSDGTLVDASTSDADDTADGADDRDASDASEGADGGGDDARDTTDVDESPDADSAGDSKNATGESCEDPSCGATFPPGGGYCDTCEGEWCYTPPSGTSDAYCTKQCADDAECEEYGPTWECDAGACIDTSRQ